MPPFDAQQAEWCDVCPCRVGEGGKGATDERELLSDLREGVVRVQLA